jgi:hypothetical protein
MAQGALEEISGIKPKISLEDGKDDEVGSASRYVHGVATSASVGEGVVKRSLK